ncbi:hypothetical protein ES703_100293 [subsurface metagenome]
MPEDKRIAVIISDNEHIISNQPSRKVALLPDNLAALAQPQDAHKVWRETKRVRVTLQPDDKSASRAVGGYTGTRLFAKGTRLLATSIKNGDSPLTPGAVAFAVYPLDVDTFLTAFPYG